MHLTSNLLALILSLQLLLGGLARLPIPSPSRIAAAQSQAKADALKSALPPSIQFHLNADQLMQAFGAVMCLASVLVSIPRRRVRRAGLVVAGAVLGVGLWSGVFAPAWLPVVNLGVVGGLWGCS